MLNIFSAPVVNLRELNNLFIELTAKNCNQRCKHCYIDFPISKSIKDFISLDRIKNALNDTTEEKINCIYLTGAEPMTHPDFNSILRLCLKRANVCICTNASYINEKKARFLKKVEDESSNQIIFRLSLDHYNEVKNDDIRVRGAYRHTINAIKNLVKYGFAPIINITNYYHEDKKVLTDELLKLMHKIGYETAKESLCISEHYNKFNPNLDSVDIIEGDYDCKNGRILTESGIYSCPFLSNDHRGWMGTDFKDYSKKAHLESNFCFLCCKNKSKIFGFDW